MSKWGEFDINEMRKIWKPNEQITCKDINAENRVFLASIIQATGISNTLIINKIEGYENSITPSCNMVYEKMRQLYICGIISPLVEECSRESFRIREDGSATHHMNSVRYIINIKDFDFKNLMYPADLSNRKRFDLLFLVERILQEEAIEYLLYQTKKIGIKIEEGNLDSRFINVINNMIKNFPLSLVYSLIFSAVTQTIRFYLERHYNKQVTIGYIRNKLENYTQCIFDNTWNKKYFNRIKQLPQSIISSICFSLLGYEVGYFNMSYYDIKKDLEQKFADDLKLPEKEEN
jgi:hypothetical protein